MLNARIIADSINPFGQRLTTFVFPRFPKCLLAELNTHRVFSRNAASSRAIPLEKMIAAIRADPYLPDWAKRGKGMGGPRLETPTHRRALDELALHHLEDAIKTARDMHFLEAAKENVNRFLEPWARVSVIVTSTEWTNFLLQRCKLDAQADFRAVALEVSEQLAEHAPLKLRWNDWHIPFINATDRGDSLTPLLKVATARCARVSYLNHEGKQDIDADLALHDRLLEDRHMSPFEHSAQATPGIHANFTGFRSYRQEVGL